MIKPRKKIIEYVPHGLNHDIFKPIDQNNPEFKAFKQQIFKGKEYDFVLFFNSRNIRRKQIPDTLLAYKYFVDTLSEEQAKTLCFLITYRHC